MGIITTETAAKRTANIEYSYQQLRLNQEEKFRKQQIDQQAFSKGIEISNENAKAVTLAKIQSDSALCDMDIDSCFKLIVIMCSPEHGDFVRLEIIVGVILKISCIR